MRDVAMDGLYRRGGDVVGEDGADGRNFEGITD